MADINHYKARVVDAMCMTWLHDFGLDKRKHELGSCGMTDEERDALRRQMGQLYDQHIAHLAEQASVPVGVEEVEVVGYRFFHVDHGYIFRRTHIYEGNPSLEAHGLMTVAQHNRIVSALQKENEHLIYLLSCAKNYDLGPTLKGMVEDALTKHKDSNKL